MTGLRRLIGSYSQVKLRKASCCGYRQELWIEASAENRSGARLMKKLKEQQTDFAAGITKLPMMLPASGFRDSSGCKRRER